MVASLAARCRWFTSNSRVGISFLPLLAMLALAGCSDQSAPAARSAKATNPPLYGEPTGKASDSIPRARPNTNNAAWQSAPFWFLQTELSPATLYHCASNHLSLFTGMTNSGLGAPSWLAFSTMSGPRSFTNGALLDVKIMEENWVVVWFSGARGWTNWDSPWVVYLQHKPTRMKLDDDGLHLQFRQAAGDVVVMPLYGYAKAPLEPATNSAAARSVQKETRPETWKWGKGLLREPLVRIRYWASATREFPIYCEDSFSVDRAKDSVTFRQKFTWRSINDDWNTKHLKVAPISPPLALASIDRDFPARFSKPPMDFEIMTPAGPFLGFQDADSYDVTFPVLQYIHETEASDPPNTSTNAHPTVAAALKKLQDTGRAKFRRADRYEYDHGGLDNFCWAILGDQWYAKALPYYDPATRSNALASLRLYFRDDVLVTNRFKLREFPKGSGRDYWILEGPGIGSWGVLGDAGKFSANLLETLWAYAHFSGDWDLVRERWPLVKKLFTTGAETRWSGFGRDSIAELGDEAAPCLAMARLAYKVGDMDTYHYACALFARELTHHWVKQRGAAYIQKNQPFQSNEPMDDEVYLTNLWGDTAGWQIDGPKYPKETGERQFNNRWVRFKDADVGRFYRDYLRPEVKAEIDRLQTRWPEKRRFVNDSHIMPSLVQLRSLLLNESPAELAKVATPDQFAGPPSGVIASCLAVLRTSRPIRYERLIAPGAPNPFVAGLEREVGGPNPYLAQTVQYRVTDRQTREGRAIWPRITWWGWKTPTGARWNFGQVRPVPQGEPATNHVVPLNWNTEAVVYPAIAP